MKTIHLLSASFAALLTVGALSLVGCSGDDDDNTVTPGADSGPGTDGGPSTGDGGPGTDSGPPGPPTLGAQIDRFGRPAINTALNHAFDINASAKGAAKDAYNADQGESGWKAAYTAQFAANLGVLDSLDTMTNPGDGCGNQLGFTLSGSYSGLAAILTDDRQYLDSSQSTCTTYLSVELNALTAGTDSECGGRKLGYDVIATTYGAASGANGFDDGVTAPSSAPSETFPYLADPH